MAGPGLGPRTGRHLPLARRGQALTARMWNQAGAAVNAYTDAVTAANQTNGGLPKRPSGDPHTFEVLVAYKIRRVYVATFQEGQEPPLEDIPIEDRSVADLVVERRYVDDQGYLLTYDDNLLREAYEELPEEEQPYPEDEI